MLIDILPALTSASLSITLASASPRRLSILALIGIRPPMIIVMPSTFAEDLLKDRFQSPAEYCVRTCREKAMEVWQRVNKCGNNNNNNNSTGTTTATTAATTKPTTTTPKAGTDIIISADSIVVIDGQILEKPIDVEDAKRMMRLLSGRSHQVLTAMTLLRRRTERDLEIPSEQSQNQSPNHESESESYVERTFCCSTEVKMATLTEAMIDAYVLQENTLDKSGGYGVQSLAAQFIEGIQGDYYNAVGLPLHAFCREFRAFVQPLLPLPINSSSVDSSSDELRITCKSCGNGAITSPNVCSTLCAKCGKILPTY